MVPRFECGASVTAVPIGKRLALSTKSRDDVRGEQFQCFPIILERPADQSLHTRVLISPS